MESTPRTSPPIRNRLPEKVWFGGDDDGRKKVLGRELVATIRGWTFTPADTYDDQDILVVDTSGSHGHARPGARRVGHQLYPRVSEAAAFFALYAESTRAAAARINLWGKVEGLMPAGPGLFRSVFVFSVAVPLLAGCAGAAPSTALTSVAASSSPAAPTAEASKTVVAGDPAGSPAAPTLEPAAENIACQLMDPGLFKTLTGKILEPYDQNVVGRSSNCTELWPVPANETGGAYGIHVTADADLVKNYDGTLNPYIAGGGGVTTTVTADKQIILQDDPAPSPTRLIAGIPCAEVDSFRACRYKDYTLLFYPGTKGNVTDLLVESALKKVHSGLL